MKRYPSIRSWSHQVCYNSRLSIGTTMESRVGSHIPVALITGASRGLGCAMAFGFSQAGYRVAVNYRMSTVEALETARAIEAAGGAAMPHQADVRDGKAVQAMVSAMIERWERLDVLVCNAAISHDELVIRAADTSWDAVVETILTGTFHCLQAAGAVMQRQGGGGILLIGSRSGFQGRGGQAPYAAAKAGLLGLMKSLAREWGDDQIRINMILPGWHPTALTAHQEDSTPPPFGPVLGQGTTMAAVADFAVALASMPHVSGQVFNLDSRILSL